MSIHRGKDTSRQQILSQIMPLPIIASLLQNISKSFEDYLKTALQRSSPLSPTGVCAEVDWEAVVAPDEDITDNTVDDVTAVLSNLSLLTDLKITSILTARLRKRIES
ncbi:hypothetical protein ACJ72_02877 [Emergomyces africanus]|uniref:Uncharacterized protein n=1 Tax=Emergomyces africanus TaxID=1955775 RepID=A0A1B7P164_9EURO|nr:hypothetical protein ACJ72_02877 [Emergomyces africanus]